MLKLKQQLATIIQKFSLGQRRIIGNIIWLFIDRFIQISLSLVVGLWVARYLGPENFGLLNYSTAFIALFSSVSGLGLESIVVRDLTRSPQHSSEILGTAFVLKLIGSIISIPLAIGALIILRPNDDLAKWVVAILAVGSISSAFNIISFWFQSQIESKYTVAAKNAAYIIICATKLVLIQVKAPLIIFVLVSTGEMILGAVGLIITYQISGYSLRSWQYSFQWVKRLLRDSLPMIITGAVAAIYMRIDSVMIGQMMNDYAVGIYAAVMKIAEMWYFIPAAIVSTIFPIVIKTKEISEKLYYKRAQQLFTLIAALSYLVAIPISFLGGYLMKLFYGEAYVEGGAVLSVYVWAGLFVSLGVARGPWMVAGDLLNFRATTAVLGAAINIFLNYLLIPIYGIMGATIATVIAQLFASYLANAFHPKAREIFIRQTKGILLLGFFSASFLLVKRANSLRKK